MVVFTESPLCAGITTIPIVELEFSSNGHELLPLLPGKGIHQMFTVNLGLNDGDNDSHTCLEITGERGAVLRDRALKNPELLLL